MPLPFNLQRPLPPFASAATGSRDGQHLIDWQLTRMASLAAARGGEGSLQGQAEQLGDGPDAGDRL
jgi:hypothetical protein